MFCNSQDAALSAARGILSDVQSGRIDPEHPDRW